MTKDRIILKTHGVHTEKEVGIIILPSEFYVKVTIEENGDFMIKFTNLYEEPLFSVESNVKGKVIGTPIKEDLKNTEKKMAGFIVDSMAEFLLDENSPTYDTKAALEKWAKYASHAFSGCQVDWDTDKK